MPGWQDGPCCPLLSSQRQSQPVWEPILGRSPRREVKPSRADNGNGRERRDKDAQLGVHSPPHGWHGGRCPCPSLPSLFPKGGREPCASPRDCDKHYTEAINV